MNKLSNSRWWSTKRGRWVVRLTTAFLVYSLIGLFLLPPIIKWLLVRELPKTTKRTAEVRQVRVNPYTLSLTVRGLKLKEPNGDLFASWEEFFANFQLSSLFRWAWTFKEIHLIDPFGSVILQKNGELNLANMFEPDPNAPPKPKEKSEVSRVNIFLLSITNGFVSFDDQTRKKPFHTEYRPISILLRNFTTRPGTGTPYSFVAESDAGRKIDWAGDITVQPFSSGGRIDLEGLQPRKYNPYIDDYTTAQVADGRINIHGDYYFAAGTNGVDLIVTNGAIKLMDLKIDDTDTKETVLSIPELAVDGLQFNLRERQARLDKFKISSTELLTRLNQDGSVNLLRLLVPPPTNNPPSTNVSTAPPSTSPPWVVDLAEFHLTNATVTFEDRTHKTAFQTKLSPINITLKDFTTRPDTNASYKFSVTSEASEKIEGGGTVSVNPVRSAGEVSIAGIELKKYMPYIDDFLRGQIESGKVDFSVAYQAAVPTNAPLTASASNTTLRLTDLKLKSPDSDEIPVVIPEFTVEGAEANLAERSARVARTKTVGGKILVRREKNDDINLLALLQPSQNSMTATNSLESDPPAAATTETTTNTNAPWTASIDEIALENYSIDFEDKKPVKPTVVKLDQFTHSIKGFTTAGKEPLTTTIATRVNESGFINSQGKITLKPLSAGIDLSVTNIDLRAIQPYLEEHAKLELSSGLFNLASRIKWESTSTSNNTGHLQFEGGLSIAQFTTKDQLSSQPLLNWTNLAVEGIKFEMQPDSLHIDTVRWDGLQANVLISSNKQLNITSVLPPKSTNAALAEAKLPTTTAEGKPAATEERSAKSPSPLPITLSTFVLTNSELHVVDASVQPASEVELKHFGGTITGLSSEPKATADLNLAGSIGDQSPISISGRVNPLAGEPVFDLTISNRNMQLSPFTPYVEKFSGHPLNKGRLSMALHYEVQGKQLKAQNQILLDQLTLGPRVENSDAPNLPVKLGIALLKDSKGQINLDVPVTGRLDDPQFRVGPIIMKVLVNMITKAAASPFKLIGAAVGGGDELSFLAFEPGSAEFLAGETNKITKLAKALKEKSGLSLDIEASVDPKRDRDALARNIVEQQIKAARIQELTEAGQAPASPESFQLEPGEDQRLLRAAVVEKFGTNLTQAIQDMKTAMATNNVGSAAGSESAKSGEKKTKWYKSFMVPFEKKNSPAKIARRQAKADAELLKQNPELGALTPELMEKLLASKTEVPPDQFVELMKQRADTAHKALLNTSELSEDRINLIAPKPLKEGYRGESRVNLSLN